MIRSKLFSVLRSMSNVRQLSSSCSLNSALNPSCPDSDPFGLEESKTEVSSIVQGLYTSTHPITSQQFETNQTDIDAKGNDVGAYKRWLDEAASRQFLRQVTSDSEFVHNASFGTIRLDSENPAREQDEQPSDDTLNLEGRTPEPLKPGSDNVYMNSNRQINVKVQEESVKNLNDNPEKSNVDQEGSTVCSTVPSVYEMPSLNDLTHSEMWGSLRHRVVFQNDFLLAINKPYGLPMHTPSKECRHTILNFIDELTTLSKSPEPVDPVHRLDKDTTGVLIFAKTQVAATIMKERFASRKVKKLYLVITKNCPPMKSGTIEIPIAEGKIGGTKIYRSVLKPDLRMFKIANSQDGAKNAVTHFKVISSTPHCSFMEVKPETGLKHQIRIHLGMGLGCPVLGDHKYSHRDKLAPQRLDHAVLERLNIKQSKVRHLPIHLHCSSIEFTMPENFSSNYEPVFVHTRPPKHFMHTLLRLKLK